MTAGLEVMQPQTKDHLEPEEPEEPLKDPALEPGPAGTLTLCFLPPNGRKVTSCCFYATLFVVLCYRAELPGGLGGLRLGGQKEGRRE